MSVEDLNNQTAVADALDTGTAPETDESEALGAIWDQHERDNGAARDNGKFAAADDQGKTPDGLAQEGEGKGEAGKAAVSTPAANAVPLPANWNGMADDWAKIPADVQAKIAARDTDIHQRMSEQGRQINEFKPYAELFERNKDLLQGKKMPDGTDPTMFHGVDFLFTGQRRLDQNPIASLIEIADRYGVRNHLAAALTGQAPIPSDRQPAGVQPADVERIIKDALSEDAQSKAADAELSRLSKDKPLYADIAEADMVHAIHKARAKLGDAASKEAVFDMAYDIAVNADPDLRKKADASRKAAAANPKRVADARRSNAVNVASTSTGQTRQLSDEEMLGQVYDEMQAQG